MADAYPTQLAEFVRNRWHCPDDRFTSAEHCPVEDGLPEPPILERLLSVAYQAGLLRDEGRPVTFRLILLDPTRIPCDQGPPGGLHRLEFTQPRPFTSLELKQLSQAADYFRSLIGIAVEPGGEIRIWGIVHSGPRWLREVEGGRRASMPLPPVLVVKITGPGSIEVCRGSTLLARLDRGKLIGKSVDVLQSKWLSNEFAPYRKLFLAAHADLRTQAQTAWADLDPEVVRLIGRHMIRRMIAAIGDTHHGGSLVFVPPERIDELCRTNRYLNFKYKISDGEPRRRWGTLIVKTLNSLAEVHGSTGRTVGWPEYERSNHETIVELDEAIFELSYLIARLAAVDGAVVLTKQFELFGFGSEIKLELVEVRTVAKALDLEGHRTEIEPVENVGTRHRSAYRLCHEMPDASAIVVSQDNGVRFIKNKEGIVTYWDHGGG